MHWETVTIVGVGLLGGSIGLALRERRLARSVIGVGRREASLRKARERGAVSRTTTSLERGAAEADLIVVCTPVETIVPTVRQAAAHAPSHALITDVGSTKGAIVHELERDWREAGWEERPRFIGSHPLAGSEKTGAGAARADLFVNRVVIVTPTDDARPGDYRDIESFWQALGATVVRQSPSEHDETVAAISHLPHLVASALAAGTRPSLLPLVAGGWLDATRVAAGDVELWRQILSGNRDHVLKSLDKFEKVLDSFRQALAGQDDAELVRLLEVGKRNRDAVGN